MSKNEQNRAKTSKEEKKVLKFEDDPIYRLKYIGYCTAHLPPKDEITTYTDFVNYARFQLCNANHVLMKDPVWEKYTDEDIIAEYFAVLYTNNKEELEKVEFLLAGESPDIADWFEKMEKQNKKDLEKTFGNGSKEIHFNPNDIMGE